MKPDFRGKKMAAQIWAKWTKIGPETRFLDSLISLEIAYSDSLGQFLTTGRDKTWKSFGSNGSKFPQLGFFCHFFKFGSLVFLEIA